ncbi:hypothetical protein [Hyphomicrobium sulfonivorans]|uniref:hypothetical protein n=1 Tax=Hyphomicrobium sulfonivorans TaxID=121290 RepID=UPI0008392432|nr:hypothetical protein [Hyphomicrobium sulfonivorans]
MMRVILLSLVAVFVASAPVSAEPSLALKDPRSFGYFLGDTLTREVILRVDAGETLEMASVPLAGPVNYWLELNDVKLDTESSGGGSTTYRLVLNYQTFYTPLDPRKLTIPGFALKVAGASGTGEVTVPGFEFISSPIRQLFASSSQSSGSSVALQPDVVPYPLTTGRERTAMLVSGLIALASLIALAWHQAWWPFHKRAARPFTDTARYLRSNAGKLQDASGYRTALLRLHRAFDLRAGRRVLADDVDGFLADHPEFKPYAAEVEAMFASSRQTFFGNNVDGASKQLPLSALTDLSSKLAVAERSAG